ncbi:hypothetical protein Tco_1109260 [Tanacetum coccineum]
MSTQQKNKFFKDVKHYFWDDPFLFKICADQVIRRCVHGNEALEILSACQMDLTGGHHGANLTPKRSMPPVSSATSYKDAPSLSRTVTRANSRNNFTKRDEMPQNSIKIARIVKTLSFVIHQEFHILSFNWESDILILSTNENGGKRGFVVTSSLRGGHGQYLSLGDLIRSGYHQKGRKPSQNDKTEHGMEKTVQNQGQSPKMSKSESILKNTIECNLYPSDGPGKPNSISMKTVKTLKAQS